MHNVKTQIYGTFGPACKSREILEAMIKAGMTGMRLNLSHTTLEKSKDYIENYRIAAASQKVNPQILIDMQGPELRVGEMEEILVEAGETVFLKKSENHSWCEGKERTKLCKSEKVDDTFAKREDCVWKGGKYIPVPDAVLSVIKEGNEILLDDGKIHIQIEEVKTYEINAKVLRGGILRPHKSIKIIDVNVKMPILTEHDITNIRQAKKYGVTALMQPFVFSGEDLRQVKAILKRENAENIQIFAKIENRVGVKHLEDILQQADVVVIARGDLGNDMPLWELPAVQKRIESICKKYQKPYMVVTQMLASMEQNPVPTRAEVSDIFHAVYQGAEAVMVTGETAVGKYPVEVIQYLANTAKEAVEYKS